MTDATVIIAAFKASDTLERSVSSALAQEGVTLEVIVIDDASPDGTGALAERLAGGDDRVRTLRLERNGGPGAARNAGIDAARGTWIAVLDSDDAMAPGRLARMIDVALRTGADAVYDNFQPVDEAGAPSRPPHMPRVSGPEERWTLTDFLRGNQARPGIPSLGFLKPVFRRNFLVERGVRYDTTLRNGEDFHIMAELLAQGGALWFTPEPGYLYTTRRGSISNRLNPDHVDALARADRAFLERHAARLDDAARGLLQRRIARIGDLAATERSMIAFRQRNLGGGVAALLRRPRSVRRFAVQIGEALKRRIRF